MQAKQGKLKLQDWTMADGGVSLKREDCWAGCPAGGCSI